MLDGCTPWPAEVARRYRDDGAWRGETLGSTLRAAAARFGDSTALVHRDRTIGYAELDDWADRLAAGFAARGVRPGDRIVVQLPNVPDFVAVVFALMRLGAKPIFSLVAHRVSEITHLVELGGATGYVVPDEHRGFDHRELAREVAAATGLRHVFVLGDAAEFVSVADLSHHEPARFPEPDPGDVAFFLLSGGTTALPKLIPRTHDDYVYQTATAARICQLSTEDVYLAVLPVEFNFAFGCPGVVGTLVTGGTAVLADTPNPMDCFELVERHGATVTALVPSIVQLWLEVAEWTPADLSSLRLLQVGGARMTREFTERIGPTLGVRLQQVFGMAEGLLCFSRHDDPPEWVLTTQGRPISDLDEIRVVDPAGRVLPPDTVGELVTRGPYTLRGYYRVPDYNRRAFDDDGFFHTGDLARITENGNLVIEGRIKEMIIRGGDKVSANEVEDHLLSHPSVTSAAVVGVPDEFLGERICAYLIGDEVPAHELKAAMHARGVADYKLPDVVRFVAEFPLTPLGKVDKKALVSMAAGARPVTQEG